jgi:DNA ligase (NAD+)
MDTNKRTKELESLIEKNIALYYNNSNKAVSNVEFDSWVEELEYLNPDSPVLNIMENKMGDYEKVVLPFRLYSQRKTKTWIDISNWINSTLSEMKKAGLENKELKLVITPKLDGIHLMEYNKNTFTRGEDGVEGYKVSSRTKYFLNIGNGYDELAFGGEIITSKKVYKEYFETAGYTSPRNLIQSFFSNLEVPKNIDKVDYIRYSVYNKELNKDEQLDICNIVNKIKIDYKILNVWDLSEKYLDSLFEKWSEFYNIDGLVIDINDYQTRKALGYRNKYPKFSISFKPERYNQELIETKINDIRLQISRYGKIAPVAEVDSVFINNGNVTNVSLYNMKYVYDNNICIGQRGFVFRSGSINPI